MYKRVPQTSLQRTPEQQHSRRSPRQRQSRNRVGCQLDTGLICTDIPSPHSSDFADFFTHRQHICNRDTGICGNILHQTDRWICFTAFDFAQILLADTTVCRIFFLRLTFLCLSLMTNSAKANISGMITPLFIILRQKGVSCNEL